MTAMTPDHTHLNRAIAKKLGWKIAQRPSEWFPHYHGHGKPLMVEWWTTPDGKEQARPAPLYSESADAALLVVEALRREGWTIECTRCNGWVCRIMDGRSVSTAYGHDTFPLAICMAAAKVWQLDV